MVKYAFPLHTANLDVSNSVPEATDGTADGTAERIEGRIYIETAEIVTNEHGGNGKTWIATKSETTPRRFTANTKENA